MSRKKLDRARNRCIAAGYIVLTPREVGNIAAAGAATALTFCGSGGSRLYPWPHDKDKIARLIGRDFREREEARLEQFDIEPPEASV